ncbi:MAG TPA: gamma-glutamyltransferase [Rhizomicrobium sp.]|nr:gamma-glutamyltransferase [Rhizomicrobium sp.]
MIQKRVVAVLGGLFLTGCSSISGLFEGETPPGLVTPTGAYVVGDEAQAVKAGAAVLAEGGSAADAVTAIYFAMSVTYPVAAGLGGGGLCIVRNANGNVETFGFLTRDSKGGGPYALAGNVRGFWDLQHAYGKLTWDRLMTPAETMATSGFAISDALETRLNASLDILRLDANLAYEFLDDNGNLKPAGTMIVNTDIAKTLTAIKTQGPDGFYRGEIGKKIVDYAMQQGSGISADEFASYVAMREPAQSVVMGDLTAYIPPGNLGAGAFSVTLLRKLTDVMSSLDIGQATRETLEQFQVEALPKDLGATGFAAIDKTGESVACGVTMNGSFGSGRTTPVVGVTLARAPASSAAGLSSAFITPVIASRGQDGAAVTGVGSGGPNGAASMAYVLLRSARGDELTQTTDLRTTGLAPFSTVNAIACQKGSCAPLNDPGSSGLGMGADGTVSSAGPPLVRQQEGEQ